MSKQDSCWYVYLVVLLLAAAIYLGCIFSPPSLMDDVDAVQAQLSRNMLVSGDWVTAHLDGIPYLEKPPLLYWLIASSYKIFGAHDWSARIPILLSILALSWVTCAFGVWAFGKRAGLYVGMCLATCVGLFLFTRILIPDVMLTLTTALAMWAFLRAIDDDEPHPRFWAFLCAANLGLGLLLKSLIAIVFPVGAAVVYLLLTRQLFSLKIWKRLHPFSGALVILVVAAPWHILATLRNPPYFALTLHSGPNDYHGFLWFFFINEQLLRFLNMRYPRDYNTVPRAYFWLFHLIWLFPWSVYFPAVAKLSFKPMDRAGRVRLLCLCWFGFILVFFTFSTTQEYYSMPCYPALALLLGSAMATEDAWVRRGNRALAAIAACAAIAAFAIYWNVRNLPAPGDISSALSRNPSAYTLSLGHMLDLTLPSFAYLRIPLLIAAFALLLGALGNFRATGSRAFLASALMMVFFLQAARLAMVTFDPYLSSQPLAVVLLKSPEGTLITKGHYWPTSSIYFYTNRTGLLLNGRVKNLEYGSNAPGAPDVFINDAKFAALWTGTARYYLVAPQTSLARLEALVGAARLKIIAQSGGKLLMTNLSIPGIV
ncbi:MAG TPA: glycosyltransferase family 39 protein [Candidatus Solibacter sp.]|nr:glycosyltransferase family 39 protein [Candidatus Solibacter sp.]